MNSRHYCFLLLLSLFFATSCADDGNSNSPQDSSDADSDTDADTDTDTDADADTDTDTDADTDGDTDTVTGPSIEIVVVGDAETLVDFADGYPSQTPSDFIMGIQRLDLLTSVDDPSPQTVFDAGTGAYAEVDMLGTTSLATIAFSDLTDGIYTHARVLLAMTSFKVQTRVHPLAPLPAVNGPVSVVAALSDTVIDSTDRAQGWMQYSFSMGGIDFNRVDTLPEFPDSATGDIIQQDGQTWLLMNLSDNMTINPSITTNYTATVEMRVNGCFRWEDTATSGYATDIFDSEPNGDHETLMSFGPGEYQVVVE